MHVSTRDKPGLERLSLQQLSDLDSKLVEANLPKVNLFKQERPCEHRFHKFAGTIAGLACLKLPPCLPGSCGLGSQPVQAAQGFQPLQGDPENLVWERDMLANMWGHRTDIAYYEVEDALWFEVAAKQKTKERNAARVQMPGCKLEAASFMLDPSNWLAGSAQPPTPNPQAPKQQASSSKPYVHSSQADAQACLISIRQEQGRGTSAPWDHSRDKHLLFELSA